jgi:surface polysaccharide O-acyltransferase-like enzyme
MRRHVIPRVLHESESDEAEREFELYADRTYELDTQQQLDRRKFRIKMAFLGTLSSMALVFAVIGGIVLFSIAGYLVALVLIHYTAPGLGWLKVEELNRLENGYASLAIVAVPVMLMGNGWLIWMASRRNS